MEITEAQYQLIAPILPVQRGNVSLPNLQVLNAILYVAEQGCKWRGLPPRFGNWHTVYMRMNRWSKNGVLDRVFEYLQREQIVPNPPPSGREGFSDAGRGLEGESVGGQCLDSMVKEASDGSQDGLADVFGSCGTQHRQRARLSRFKYWRVVRVDQAPGGPCARAAILRRAMTNSS